MSSPNALIGDPLKMDSRLRGNDTVFRGIETWYLYEAGLRHFLDAMENEKKTGPRLEALLQELKEEKEKTYSRELLALDQALEKFQKNELDLTVMLKKLATVNPPPKDSELALLLEQTGSGRDGDAAESLDAEVKKIAKQIELSLRGRTFVLSKELRRATGKSRNFSVLAGVQNDMTEFNRQSQDFQTSRISAQDFALFLKEMSIKHRIRIRVSKKLNVLVGRQKRMKDIEGSRLFDDFEKYQQLTKETLFRNEEEKNLDQRGHQLALVERLQKLELARPDWIEIQNLNAKIEYWNVSRDGVTGKGDIADLLTRMKPNLEFYRNSEKRDRALFENLIKQMSLSSPHAFTAKQPFRGRGPASGQVKTFGDGVKSAVLVAGGFHAEGLTSLFRSQGISYVLIMPGIAKIPEETNYRKHMHGEVTWGDYFEVENGKVNLYNAFVRGARDQLLSSSPNALIGDDKRLLLKTWRDNIIRNLASQDRITESGDYTKFIDEITAPEKKNNSSGAKWRKNVKNFIEGMRSLKAGGQITEQNISKLLQAGLISPGASGVPLAKNEMSASLIPALHSRENKTSRAAVSSEVPNKVNPARPAVPADRAQDRSEARTISESEIDVDRWIRETRQLFPDIPVPDALNSRDTFVTENLETVKKRIENFSWTSLSVKEDLLAISDLVSEKGDGEALSDPVYQQWANGVTLLMNIDRMIPRNLNPENPVSARIQEGIQVMNQGGVGFPGVDKPYQLARFFHEFLKKTVRLVPGKFAELPQEKQTAAAISATRSFVILPDGRLAAGDNAGRVRIRDLKTGDIQELHEKSPEGTPDLNAHPQRIIELLIAPDGRLITVDGDGRSRIWNVETGTYEEVSGIWTEEGVEWPLSAEEAIITSDGRLAIMDSGKRGLVRIWDLAEKTSQKLPLIESRIGVSSFALDPRGRFVTGNNDNTVAFWDLQKGTHKILAAGGNAYGEIQEIDITRLAVLPAGRLVTGYSTGQVISRNFKTRKRSELVEGSSHEVSVGHLITGPDGNLVITNSSGDVEIFDFQTAALRTLHEDPEDPYSSAHPGGISATIFTSEGHLATADFYGNVRLWPMTPVLISGLYSDPSSREGRSELRTTPDSNAREAIRILTGKDVAYFMKVGEENGNFYDHLVKEGVLTPEARDREVGAAIWSAERTRVQDTFFNVQNIRRGLYNEKNELMWQNLGIDNFLFKLVNTLVSPLAEKSIPSLAAYRLLDFNLEKKLHAKTKVLYERNTQKNHYKPEPLGNRVSASKVIQGYEKEEPLVMLILQAPRKVRGDGGSFRHFFLIPESQFEIVRRGLENPEIIYEVIQKRSPGLWKDREAKLFQKNPEQKDSPLISPAVIDENGLYQIFKQYSEPQELFGGNKSYRMPAIEELGLFPEKNSVKRLVLADEFLKKLRDEFLRIVNKRLELKTPYRREEMEEALQIAKQALGPGRSGQSLDEPDTPPGREDRRSEARTIHGIEDRDIRPVFEEAARRLDLTTEEQENIISFIINQPPTAFHSPKMLLSLMELYFSPQTDNRLIAALEAMETARGLDDSLNSVNVLDQPGLLQGLYFAMKAEEIEMASKKKYEVEALSLKIQSPGGGANPDGIIRQLQDEVTLLMEFKSFTTKTPKLKDTLDDWEDQMRKYIRAIMTAETAELYPPDIFSDRPEGVFLGVGNALIRTPQKEAAIRSRIQNWFQNLVTEEQAKLAKGNIGIVFSQPALVIEFFDQPRLVDPSPEIKNPHALSTERWAKARVELEKMKKEFSFPLSQQEIYRHFKEARPDLYREALKDRTSGDFRIYNEYLKLGASLEARAAVIRAAPEKKSPDSPATSAPEAMIPVAGNIVDSLDPEKPSGQPVSQTELREIYQLSILDLEGLIRRIEETLEERLKTPGEGSEEAVSRAAIAKTRSLLDFLKAWKTYEQPEGEITLALHHLQEAGGQDSFLNQLLTVLSDQGKPARLLTNKLDQGGIVQRLQKQQLTGFVKATPWRARDLAEGLRDDNDVPIVIPDNAANISTGLNDAFVGLTLDPGNSSSPNQDVEDLKNLLLAVISVFGAHITQSVEYKQKTAEEINRLSEPMKKPAEIRKIKASVLKAALLRQLAKMGYSENVFSKGASQFLALDGNEIVNNLMNEMQSRAEVRKAA